jgi:hypothetical protein
VTGTTIRIVKQKYGRLTCRTDCIDSSDRFSIGFQKSQAWLARAHRSANDSLWLVLLFTTVMARRA